MTSTERKLAAAEDRVKRLTKQCAELQCEVKELRMIKFQEIPASKKSLTLRKLVFGIGINDASYVVQPIISGKKMICPYYKRWQAMLRRCYQSKCHEKQPTYIGCTTFTEWLTFSNFKSWMIDQDWEGMQLDKDLLVSGNKMYSPEFCIFIPSSLNKLLIDCAAARGDYPQGVSWHKKNGKFVAHCHANGKIKYLGCFSTPEAASTAYKIFKSSHIKEIAEDFKSNVRLYDGLINHANLILRSGL